MTDDNNNKDKKPKSKKSEEKQEPKEKKPRKPRQAKQPRKEQDYSKLSSQGTKIMKRAQQIRLKDPDKGWNMCVSEAGKEFKQLHKPSENKL
jgi:hypothetical protein